MISARGLSLKLKDFEFILSANVLKTILDVTGPASRILQSVASDLAISTHLIKTSISKLESIRGEDCAWDGLLSKAETFADSNNVPSQLQMKRNKKTPRQPGELATDDRPTDPLQAFKINAIYSCLDTVIS